MDDRNTSTVEFPQSSISGSPTGGESNGMPRRRLGRGIGSLLGGLSEPTLADETTQPLPADAPPGEFGLIDEALISRNPYQPRKEFDPAELAEMVESVTQHGVLQPLLVRAHDGGYQLIAGERRLLAARKVGLSRVPCRVVTLDDKGVCEVAIIENVQRADLSDLEKAQAFQDYLDKFGGTIEELATRMGKNRSTISNCLRLLELPDRVKISLGSGKITAGHARALLPLEEEADQITLCQRIESEKLSVRQVEEEVREKLNASDPDGTVRFPAGSGPDKSKGGQGVGNHILDLQQQLRELLGTKVEIRMKGKDAGKLVISFQSHDEFSRIVGFLKKAS
jgi:ParB family transcriptional regulator, chromosome partitioning protein